MISKACYVAAYRRKLEELACLPDMDLTLLVPPYWRTGSRCALLEPGFDTGYRMVVEDPVFNGNFHLHFYRRLPDLLQAFRPDLVHIDEEPYDFVTFHSLRASRALRARALFFTWQNIHRDYIFPFSLLERWVLGRVHGAIAGNQEAAQILRRKGYSRPLYVIPQFGIDPELFSPQEGREVPESFPPHRPFRVGYSGRLVEEKGLLVLLRALAGLPQEQGAATSWTLTFIGDGPFQARLEAEATALGIGSRVRFLGSVPSEAVAAHLKGLDLLLNPSLTWRHGRTQWKEQFGRSLVEGMACGVPVVGSDSGEIPNVVGDAGLIAPEGDVEALRGQVLRVIREPGLRRELARRGRQRFLAHYTQRRVAEQTYQCYRQLLDVA